MSTSTATEKLRKLRAKGLVDSVRIGTVVYHTIKAAAPSKTTRRSE